MLITALGLVIAWDEDSVIFQVVSFAWAGFGATFGPIMLFSLFWKRTTRAGAIAGMVGGGVMVFIRKLLIKPMGGLLGICELLPAFLFSGYFDRRRIAYDRAAGCGNRWRNLKKQKMHKKRAVSMMRQPEFYRSLNQITASCAASAAERA